VPNREQAIISTETSLRGVFDRFLGEMRERNLCVGLLASYQTFLVVWRGLCPDVYVGNVSFCCYFSHFMFMFLKARNFPKQLVLATRDNVLWDVCQIVWSN